MPSSGPSPSAAHSAAGAVARTEADSASESVSGTGPISALQGWKVAGTDKWTRDDEIGARHMLVKRDDRYVELHGLTVHVYTGPANVEDDMWPLGDPFLYGDPLRDAAPLPKHVQTDDVDSAILARWHTDDDVWKWLERYAKAVA
jgi:hypothetical protein